MALSLSSGLNGSNAVAELRSAAPGLPTVRRLEALGFRSWPANTVHYDGSWAVRLTAGHPAKRLNSVNPLDPEDYDRLDTRLHLAKERFRAFGRPLVFRLSPLASPVLCNRLDTDGWQRFDLTRVMLADLGHMDFSETVDRLPLQDVGHWIDQSILLNGYEPALKPGLSEVIGSIHAERGLFLVEDGNGIPLSALLCVHHGDVCGLFEVVTHPERRRQGHARALLSSALKWARAKGAASAFLQVVAANESAVGLYQSMGFRTAYDYEYWGA
ncbi:MAG: GNAT family N-acetyltransferase [Pseudomonadota bacterium]